MIPLVLRTITINGKKIDCDFPSYNYQPSGREDLFDIFDKGRHERFSQTILRIARCLMFMTPDIERVYYAVPGKLKRMKFAKGDRFTALAFDGKISLKAIDVETQESMDFFLNDEAMWSTMREILFNTLAHVQSSGFIFTHI